jgi:hypothetical protein
MHINCSQNGRQNGRRRTYIGRRFGTVTFLLRDVYKSDVLSRDVLGRATFCRATFWYIFKKRRFVARRFVARRFVGRRPAVVPHM